MTIRAPLITRIEPRPPLLPEVSAPNRLLDLLKGKDKQFGGVGQWKTYDYPNPRGPQYPNSLLTWGEPGRLKDLLKGKDKQFKGFGQFQTYDYPNPRGKEFPVDLRTFLNPTETQLIGKDKQFSGFGQWKSYDYPNPGIPGRANTLLTWTQSLNQTTLAPVVRNPFFQADWPNPIGFTPPALSWTQGPAQGTPFFQTDWPIPKGPVQNYDLRTFLNSVEIALIGQDRFFGGPGQSPSNLDWPIPKGQIGVISLGTWTQSLVQSTLAPPAAPLPPALYDWPIPQGYMFPQDLRTISQGFSMLDFIPQPVIPPVVTPSTSGGASGVKRYKPPAWWTEGRRVKLEQRLRKRIEAVQIQIEEKRHQIDLAPDLYRMERLIEQLQVLQKKLLDLVGQISDLNQRFEEEEVMRIYTIYRSLH